MRRIDPADIPRTAGTGSGNVVTQTVPPTQLKRKATQAGLDQTARTDNPASGSSSLPRYTQEEVEDIPHEEEIRDELFCIMSTNVVGIQYYKGLSMTSKEFACG